MSAFTSLRQHLQHSTRIWFLLTRDEQRAILIVTALFLLGIGCMTWQSAHTSSQPPGEGSSVPRWTQMQGEYVSSSMISGETVRTTLSISNKQAILVLGDLSHTLRLSRDFDTEGTALLQETLEAKGRKYRHTWPVRSLPDGALELDRIRFTPASPAKKAPAK